MHFSYQDSIVDLPTSLHLSQIHGSKLNTQIQGNSPTLGAPSSSVLFAPKTGPPLCTNFPPSNPPLWPAIPALSDAPLLLVRSRVHKSSKLPTASTAGTPIPTPTPTPTATSFPPLPSLHVPFLTTDVALLMPVFVFVLTALLVVVLDITVPA